jgi:hypothetical protein
VGYLVPFFHKEWIVRHSFFGCRAAPKFSSGWGQSPTLLYLTHLIIGGRVINLLTRFTDFWPLPSALALVMSLVTAWGMWQLVENPSTALAGRLSYRPNEPLLQPAE